MSKKILIDAVYQGHTRVVIHENNSILDFDYENSHKKQLKGNIYLARVTRVEPSLQAAFIEYGGNRHGFLPFDEIHPSYFLHDVHGFESEETGSSLADKLPHVVLPEANEEDVKEADIALQDENLEKNEESTESDESVDLEQADDDNLLDEEEIRKTIHSKYKIQDVIKKGQAILIQIEKEERGNKGAACTSYISLAGRYCVFMPNSDKRGGISRRIVDPKDRKSLKKVIDNLHLPEGISIILRTAGAGRNLNDIRRDYFYLARLWNTIREYAIKSKVNVFIHAESDLLKRTIRDLYSSEISEIQIQGNESFKTAKEFMKKILPLHANKMKEYKSKIPIFTKYNVEDQISSLYNPIAKLPSGGYIVINQTEAMISIDVNSGKATNEKNIEETATKTNVEAAVEIARQLRLRDMSGLIVVDFIDMMDSGNRKLVERTLRDAFMTDRAKVQLGNISAFGLLELSRQRLQSSFLENNTVACPACSGKGYIKSFESNGLVILRTIENEIYNGDCETLNLFAHPDIILNLLNNNRDEISKLEKQYLCKIVFYKEDNVRYDGFSIEKIEKSKGTSKSSDSPSLNDDIHMDTYDQEFIEESVVRNESQLGLGQDIAPYQVNDESIINENATSQFRHQVRKGGNFNKKRRRVNSSSRSSDKPEFKSDSSEPSQTEKRFNNKRRHNKFRKRSNNNEASKNDSVLKKWWDKLTS